MNKKKLHKTLGLIMLLPFIAWAVTGVFFFVKPGYQAAYASLSVKTYALGPMPQLSAKQDWSEVRWIRSVLGPHLLVKHEEKWQQRDPQTLQIDAQPSEQQTRRLVNDAIAQDQPRYGHIQSIDGQQVITDTGIKISLNWSQMRLQQSGQDTDFINQMYKIHYLQWTGIKALDKVLGVLGLGLVFILAMLGLTMTFRRKK